MTKFSIITPFYNTEKYIEQCISSFLEQTLDDFEFILIDDGSTDNSFKIAQKYQKQDKRITLIKSENKGQGTQRNYALNLSKGEYVYFFDSDDWLLDKYSLEKIYKKIKKDNADILIFNGYKYFQETGKTNEYRHADIFYSKFEDKPFTPYDSADTLLNINSFSTLKIFKKDFLIENDIKYTDTKFIEDSEFIVKAMLYAKKISTLNDFIANYRVHDESSSHKPHLNVKNIQKSIFICENIIKNHPDSKLFFDSFIDSRVNQLFYHFRRVPSSQGGVYKKEYYNMMKYVMTYFYKNYPNNIKNIKNQNFYNVVKYNWELYRLNNFIKFLKVHLGYYIGI